MPETKKGPDTWAFFASAGPVPAAHSCTSNRSSGATWAARQEGTESENGPGGPFFVSATVKTGPAELFRRG